MTIESSAHPDLAEVLPEVDVDRVAAAFPITLRLEGGATQQAEARAVGLSGIAVESTSPSGGRQVARVIFRLGKAEISAAVVEAGRVETASRSGHLIDLRFVEFEGLGEALVWRFAQERAREIAYFLRAEGDLADIPLRAAFDLAHATRLCVLPQRSGVLGRASEAGDGGSTFMVLRGCVSLALRAPGKSSDNRTLHVSPGQLFGGLVAMFGPLPYESVAAAASTQLLELPALSIASLEVTKPVAFRWLVRGAMRCSLRHRAVVTDEAPSPWPRELDRRTGVPDVGARA